MSRKSWRLILDHHLFKFPPGLQRPFLDARNADIKDVGMLYYYYYIIIIIIIIIIITKMLLFSFRSFIRSVMDIFGVEEVSPKNGDVTRYVNVVDSLGFPQVFLDKLTTPFLIRQWS